MNNVFQKFGKSIYLVPFKALAAEKFEHFKKSYERFGLKIELSIGDHDVDDSKLAKADIIVTTYEKMDSILRNFHDKTWINDISTIIIDEIHIVSESDRGPRLESLIVRLNEFLSNPQIIGLSATVANPRFFNSWLSSLKNETILIESTERPVPLHYRIKITQNKDSTIKKLINSTLEKNGQVIIFLNKRRSTQQLAQNVKNIVKKHLIENEGQLCSKLEKRLITIKGRNTELHEVIKNGVAFHHAGLLPKERKLIENSFKKRILKVICCTTTLSAGINTPARLVIIKDFKKYVTSGYNLKNFSGFYENGDEFSYFKPFSSNEIFQMLGRAGRPGLDSVGYGVILVNNIEEKQWVEDHYYQNNYLEGDLLPKYNDLISGLNKINILKEQVLLTVYDEGKIKIEKLKQFFERTYFWYCIRDKMKEQQIPIDQLLLINEITPINILKLHSEPKRITLLKEKMNPVKISNITNSNISGYIKTDFGVYSCQFDINIGIRCSCGFENEISDNFAEQKFSFEFCDHITSFLLYLVEIPDVNFQKYINDIVPRAVKNQYILNYLFEKGLIIKNDDKTIKCSQFGKLIIRLYIDPVSGVIIREKLENKEIQNFQELIKEAYDIIKLENRVRNYKMLEPILDWTDEEPIEKIMERYNIMAGDLYSIKENLERVITFIGIIAGHLSNNGPDLQDKMIRVAEMAETLRLRVHYGIKEELFDLVLRLDNVARVRARILFEAGYHTATQVKKESPYVLNRKTSLGINVCRKIIEGKG